MDKDFIEDQLIKESDGSSYSKLLIKRYLKICTNYNMSDNECQFFEMHHILPRAIFPQYSNFKENVWNKANLSVKAHAMVHYILGKIYPKMWDAFFLISGRNPNKSIGMISYAKVKYIEYLNTPNAEGLTPAIIRGRKTRQTKLDKGIYKEAGKKLSLWLEEIDQETGLTNAQLRSRQKDYDIYRDNLEMSLREFMSKRMSGVNNPSKNEETKRKISEGNKEWHSKNINPFKGKNHSENTLRIMREKKLGENNPCHNKIWVNNRIKNLRVKENEIPEGFVKGRIMKPQKRITCQNCGKIGPIGSMKRHHFKKCNSSNILPI